MICRRMGKPERRAGQGFTLVEVMVALAVFSIAVLALIGVQTNSLKTSADLDTRIHAEVAADNVLIRAIIEPGVLEEGASRGEEEVAGRRFRWVRTIRPTGRGNILWVDVQIYDPQVDQVVASISGFRGAN